MRKCLSVFILLFLFISLSLFADHRKHLFEQGNDYFKGGEYEKAVTAYQEILRMGYESANLYYNLGNSYYKLGKNARAILNYERALRFQPRDEDIQFNLQIANLSVIDKIPELPGLFYNQYFRKFRSFFDIRTITFMALVLYILLIFSVVVWLLNRKRFIRKIFMTTALVLLILFIVFSFTFISKVLSLKNTVEAIVMSPEVHVRSAPSEESTEIFTVHEGLKVKIIRENEGWNEIRLPDGKEGWLSGKEVEFI